MAAITQVEPVSTMQKSYQTLFSKLTDGPVILTNRGHAAAVLLSVGDYDRQRQELAFYRRQVLADERMESDEWVTGEELAAELAKMGIK